MTDIKSDNSERHADKPADDNGAKRREESGSSGDEETAGDQHPGDSGTTGLGGEPADPSQQPSGGVEGVRDNS
ncbi:MAG: hypothetical protein ABIS03_09540 [Gemmatimonadaceae bacterium]